MKIPNFETEEYFGQYEFTKPYLLSASDCESISISELIEKGQGSVDEFMKLSLGYPTMEGSHELRAGISTLYQKVTPEQIMVLGTPVEGIYLTMRTLIEPSDHVIVLAPAYDALLNVAHHITGNVSKWMLKIEGGQWKLDFDELEKLITSKTKLLVINFPHNPTGFLPGLKDLNRIIELARARGIFIFSDEMYRGLEYKTEQQLPSLADLYENAVTLSGFSKNLGLPGLRLGWLTAPNPSLYKKLLNWKAYTSMCSPQTTDYLGQMAIKAYPGLVSKNLNIIAGNIVLAEKFFLKWSDRFQWIKPQAGSVSLFKIHADSAEEYCHRLASEAGIVLLPAKFMGCPDEYARIGLGRKNFKDCLSVFDKALV